MSERADWHFHIVSYDIVDVKCRAKLSKKMVGYGQRVQKSVFECWLSPSRYARLMALIASIIDEDEDTVRVYQLCADCLPKIELFGSGLVTGLPPAAIVLTDAGDPTAAARDDDLVGGEATGWRLFREPAPTAPDEDELIPPRAVGPFNPHDFDDEEETSADSADGNSE